MFNVNLYGRSELGRIPSKGQITKHLIMHNNGPTQMVPVVRVLGSLDQIRRNRMLAAISGWEVSMEKIFI